MLETDATLISDLKLIMVAALDGEEYEGSRWFMLAPLSALANLSITEKNKRLILDADFMPLFIRAFREKGTEERAMMLATKAISNLSFAEDLTIKYPELKTILTDIANGPFEEAKKFAQLALFQFT